MHILVVELTELLSSAQLFVKADKKFLRSTK